MIWLWLWVASLAGAQSPFAFREIAPGRLELSENGRPVFVYNYGMQLKEGVPEDRRRACYLHPVWTPGGTIVTDDFPADHYHHRGIFWAWPRVKVGDTTLDLWSIRGLHQKFIRWRGRQTLADRALLEVENGWFAGERQIANETVTITAYRTEGSARRLEFTLTLEAREPVEIAGEPAQQKGYGGFSIRFGPRRETVIRTDSGIEREDSNMVPHRWAELEGDFQGRRAAVRIELDPAHPGYPNGWCLRHYGFLGVNYPGLQPLRLEPGRPLRLAYRVLIADR
jgi:hypothetical protein